MVILIVVESKETPFEQDKAKIKKKKNTKQQRTKTSSGEV